MSGRFPAPQQEKGNIGEPVPCGLDWEKGNMAVLAPRAPAWERGWGEGAPQCLFPWFCAALHVLPQRLIDQR